MENWINIPEGYQAEGDWLDTLWGPGYITFKTDIFAGTVTIHCHILIHEDQGAMGTILIENGCDGDYNDVLGDGACDYEDTCKQFATPNPTAPTVPLPSMHPTLSPSSNPTASPSADPTRSPQEQESATTLKLVLKGSLNNWKSYAMTLDTTDVEGYALAARCVEFAMKKGNYSELVVVTVDVQTVLRGTRTVEITYELTSWDRTLLDLAKANVADRVAAEDWFDDAFKLIGHEVLSEDNFVADYVPSTDDVGEWQVKQVVVVVIGGLLLLCCVAVVVVVGCRWKRKRDGGEQVRAASEVQMGMDNQVVDVRTPIIAEVGLAENPHAMIADTMETR